MAQPEAQEGYETIMDILYPVGSSRKGLPDIPHLYEPKGFVACLKLASLDGLERRRLPEAVVEDWDGCDPLPRGTAEDPEELVKEINTLYKLGQHPHKRTTSGRLHRRKSQPILRKMSIKIFP